MASQEKAPETDHPTYLSPSELGTKDYWETFYARTLAHLSSKRKPGATPTPAANTDGDQDDPSSSSEEDVDDDDDPGTSWFSEHNAPEKVLRFLISRDFPLAPHNTVRGKTMDGLDQPSILDLGTGNGSMLALLRKKGGFKGPMVGVDYSPRSVELARQLQRLRIHSAYQSDSSDDDEDDDEDGLGGGEQDAFNNNEEDDVVVASGNTDPPTAAEAIPVPAEGEPETAIRFEEWDILGSEHALSQEELQAGKGPRLDWFPYEKGGFDIVLDKGTFDAVSLSDEVVEDGKATSSSSRVVQRRICERYPSIAKRLVRKGGFLVVTSCNWTEDELIRWFTRSHGDEEDGLSVWGRVEYPRFRFGGQEGQGVCTVCFQRA